MYVYRPTFLMLYISSLLNIYNTSSQLCVFRQKGPGLDLANVCFEKKNLTSRKEIKQNNAILLEKLY